MTTRRTFLKLSALLLPSLTLAACGNQAPTVNATASTTSGVTGKAASSALGTQTAINTHPVAAATSPQSLSGAVSFFSWGSAAAVTERKAFCADFEKEHPGVTCTFSLSSGVYLDKLLTMAAGGDAPDVFFVSPTDLPAMSTKSLLQPLDAYIARAHYDLSDFVPAALQQYQRSGKTYGIPRGFGMKVMAFNVDLFQKAGIAPLPTDWKDTTWTFNAWLETTKQLTSGTGTAQIFGNLPHPGDNREWMTYVWSNGGEVFSTDYTQCLLDQAPAVEALQFLQDLMVKYQVAPSVAQQKVPTGSTDLFTANRAGTSITEATNFAALRNQAKFTWDIGVTPAGKAGRKPGAGGVGWGMWAHSKEPELAWQLLSELTGKKFGTTEVIDGTTTPPRLSVLNSAAFLQPSQPPAHAGIFAGEGNDVRTDPQPNNWDKVGPVFKAQLALLWSGKENAQTVTKAIVQAVNPLLTAPPA